MSIKDSASASCQATVIANCHTGPLAQILAFNSLNLSVDGIFLDHWNDPKSESREKGEILLKDHGDNDFLFSFVISSNFGALETSQLRSVFGEKLITFSNIRFDGLHPDTTYFGAFGGRWGNFLSEYHSKIVLHAFALGYSVTDCAKLFNGKIFESLGYYDVFAQSEAELRRRDEECDVKCCDAFFDLVREELCLLTINHPTTIVFSRIAKLLCERANITFLDFDARIYPNPLVQTVIWPIYNEVAEALSLKYRTPQYFVKPPGGYVKSSSRSLSIEEFIAGSYKFYEAHFPRAQFTVAIEQMDTDSRFRNCLA